MNILILCTGNSARSILGEVLFSDLSEGRVQGWSAGSQPKGEVNPMALKVLQSHGHSVDGLHSKSWDEFGQENAPHFDAVITVCDSAASESCPVWPGSPVTVHWGLPDPAGIYDENESRIAFEATYEALSDRIHRFLESEPDFSSPHALKHALRMVHE